MRAWKKYNKLLESLITIFVVNLLVLIAFKQIKVYNRDGKLVKDMKKLGGDFLSASIITFGTSIVSIIVGMWMGYWANKERGRNMLGLGIPVLTIAIFYSALSLAITI